MTWMILILGMAVLMYAVIAAGAARRPRSRAHRTHLDRQLVAERWAAIETLRQSPGGFKQAINEADKLLDYVLKGNGYGGQTLAERLKRAERHLSDQGAVWRAHKLRNSLAHEVGFEVTPGHAREALDAFRQSLRDLGAL